MSNTTQIPRDEQGRAHVSFMTDRELLEEAVARMRSTQDLVEGFIKGVENNPVMANMARVFGGMNRK